MPKPYEKLIGNIINWSNPGWEDNKVFKVVVANIDLDLGISLVNPDDPKDTFTCIHGPASPLYLKSESASSPVPWDERFKRIVEMLAAGHWKVEEYYEMIEIQRIRQTCINPTCVFTL